MSVRLLIVEDHPYARYELERHLDAEPGFEVVAQWLNGSDTVRLVDEHRPDVLLLDVDLPDRHGIETLKRLAALPYHVPTLGLCAQLEDETILRVLDTGGRGVIAKQSPKAVLVQSIRTVADGLYWVPPEHIAVLIDTLRTRKTLPQAPSQSSDYANDARRFRLTPRELDIVAGVALGESNREIAQRLSLAECTVKHHLSSVFDKVGVFSRVQLAVFAIHHHLVEIADFLH
jgi:two-component system nitrate/nitrite response regulator NarL